MMRAGHGVFALLSIGPYLSSAAHFPTLALWGDDVLSQAPVKCQLLLGHHGLRWQEEGGLQSAGSGDANRKGVR
jgi:hypothetical protein